MTYGYVRIICLSTNSFPWLAAKARAHKPDGGAKIHTLWNQQQNNMSN
jgi:hypothetical protein